MDSHENARTTPRGRMLMVERLPSGWSLGEVAAAAGVTSKTVRKWRDRFAAEGEAGLRDRSTRPLCSPGRLPAATVEQIEALRRQRRSGPAIARQLGVPVSTVGLVLHRLGLGQLRALDPRPAVIRYEREDPGELIHLDIKKLGRIDDASRLAFTANMTDEKKESTTTFLLQALDWFRAHGVTVPRVMTDNGSAYRSQLFASAVAARGLPQKRTRPYTPRTNGKAERFIQTSIREWAYASPFASSA